MVLARCTLWGVGVRLARLMATRIVRSKKQGTPFGREDEGEGRIYPPHIGCFARTLEK